MWGILRVRGLFKEKRHDGRMEMGRDVQEGTVGAKDSSESLSELFWNPFDIC